MLNLMCSLLLRKHGLINSTEQLQQLSPEAWAALIRFADKHNLSTLFYSCLMQNKCADCISEGQLTDLREQTRSTAVNNLILLHEAKHILEALHRANLAVIGLKGLFLLDNYYQDISLRPMSDLDLLLKREDLSEALSILGGQGYQLETYFDINDDNAEIKHVPPLVKDKKLYLELHWSIVEGDWPFNVDENGLWQRAVPASIAGVDALALSVEDLLLHLSIHFTYQHRLRNGLRGLFDFIVILNAHQWDIDWEMLFQRAQEWRVERIVALTFALLADLFGESIPHHGLTHLKSEVISPALLAAAKAQIFPAAQETQTAITPDLARLSSTSGIINKLKLVLQRIYIPRSVIARLYNVPPTSVKIYWFYPVRFTHLFVTYARTAWQILSKRQAINPSLGYEKANQELRNWMEGR